MADRGRAEILAAGTVLIRGTGAKTEVCLVHRPTQRDWSFPKGKLDPGEHAVVAAWRETAEETGAHVELGPRLETQYYRVLGRLKRVDYWIGRPVPGGPGFQPSDEIDRIAWLDPSEAARHLTYPRDHELVTAAIKAPMTVPMIILRHGQALRRQKWGSSKDSLRPLTAKGRREAKALVPVLSAFGIDTVHSSDAVRCINTVRPFARAYRLRIRPEPMLSEQGFDDGPRATLRRIRELARVKAPLVVCSHRPLLPALLKRLGADLHGDVADALEDGLPPGAMIVLHRRFTTKGNPRLVAWERHEAE